MGLYGKILFNFTLLLIIILCYLTFQNYNLSNVRSLQSKQLNVTNLILASTPGVNLSHAEQNGINIWIIFTKATHNSALSTKLQNLLKSIYSQNNGTLLHFNILSDESSQEVAKSIFNILNKYYNNFQTYVFVSFHDFKSISLMIEDITRVMTPHFSSLPGTYYSDALFYISLGLHRIAPLVQKQVILLDCDLIFKNSIQELFNEFKKFSPTNLYGIGHELSCVYRHILHNYRIKHNGTNIGSEIKRKNSFTHQNSNREINNKVDDTSTNGSPGFNSGVLLLNLERIRESLLLSNLMSEENVDNMTKKYLFKGHLGDQDFYTLLGFEHPELFHILDCSWNRQLCKWWKRSGDESLFEEYFHCDPPIRVYHGNCNSHIPDS